jgi:hypothetical protein
MHISVVSIWATSLPSGVGTILGMRVRNDPPDAPLVLIALVRGPRNPASPARVSARDAVLDKLIEQEPRQARLIMPNDGVLLQKISADADETHAPEFLDG